MLSMQQLKNLAIPQFFAAEYPEVALKVSTISLHSEFAYTKSKPSDLGVYLQDELHRTKW